MAIRTNYTFSEFFDLLKAKVNEFNSNKPTYWGSDGVATTLFQAVSYLAEFLQLQINIAYTSFSVATAKGLHLIRRIGDFGMSPIEQNFASTIQTFSGASGRVLDITIPAGTIVKTQLNSLLQQKFYTLQNDVILPSGSVSATGVIVSNIAGKAGNTASGTIIEFNSPIAQITGTINLEEVSDGVEDETDDEIRARIPKFLNGLQTSNTSAIESAVYKVNGIKYVKVVENHPTAGNFSVYVSTETGYVDTLLLSRVRNAIDKVKDICVTYSVFAPIIQNITISFNLDINGTNYNTTNLIYLIQNQVKDYINNSKKSIVYLSDIISLVKSNIGVRNINNVKINNIAEDLILNELYVAKINDVSDISITLV